MVKLMLKLYRLSPILKYIPVVHLIYLVRYSLLRPLGYMSWWQQTAANFRISLKVIIWLFPSVVLLGKVPENMKFIVPFVFAIIAYLAFLHIINCCLKEEARYAKKNSLWGYDFEK